MINNDYTYDKVAAINKKIIEIRDILEEFDNENSVFFDGSIEACEQYLNDLTDEILPYLQLSMPKLETGMFGLAIYQNQHGRISPNTLTPFVIVNDQIIYQRGGYDFIEPKLPLYSRIIRLYGPKVRNFDSVRSCYWKERANCVSDNEIWRDNSCTDDYMFYDEDESDRYTDDGTEE